MWLEIQVVQFRIQRYVADLDGMFKFRVIRCR